MIPTYLTPVLVTGTVTTVPSGTQDVNIVSSITIPVSGTFTSAPAFNATTTSVTVTTAAISLIGTNALRKGLLIQTNDPIFIRLDGVASLAVYSIEMPKKSLYEIENYCGPVSAIKASSSTVVLVTETF